MTREQALAYLSGLDESRIKPGLERIKEALLALGLPQSHYPHILVGGTNGKGSVLSFMGAGLACAGYRTGLFTSPHLVRFEERIKAGGRSPTSEELCALIESVKNTGTDLTYFEFATAMALLFFARQDVDVAVLEVGLGGTWDATNVVDPVLSVITSVDMDHMEWLGNTIGDIAMEKSGIMREGKPVVVGRVYPEAEEVLIDQAKKAGSELILYGRDFDCTTESKSGALHFKGRRWNIDGLVLSMKGYFQIENAACALAVLESLEAGGMGIDKDKAVRGIMHARWPGRFHFLEGSPSVIIDAAHNPSAVRAVVSSLGDGKNVVWVFSALSGKDVKGMARVMSDSGNRFVLVPLSHPRQRDVDEIEKEMPEGVAIEKASSVREGIALARKLAGQTGCVAIAGSVALAGEALEELKIQGFDVYI